MSPVRFLYTAALYAALPAMLPYLAKRRRLTRECFGCAPPPLPAKEDAPVIWLHAVSVGEAAAAEGVVNFLREQKCRLVLTHTTAAGGERLRARHGEYARVCRLPLDLPFAAGRFLRRIRPRLAVFMEAEYWPNLFAAMRSGGVELLIASARLGRDGARRRARVLSLTRETMAAVSIAAAQTRADARRLKFFGVRRVVAAGNLKFDRVADDAQIRAGAEWRRHWKTDKTILLIAGARPGEEELLLREFAGRGEFLRRFFVMLAPRHPERGGEVAALLSRLGIAFNRRARGDAPDPQRTDLHLADTLGEMDVFYACSDIALIGGSFLPFGGQNPIEAMSAGVAAVVGPHVENYRAFVAAAARRGALRQAENAQDARRDIVALAEDAEMRARQARAARQLCAAHCGALRAHINLLAEYLPGTPGV